MMTRTFKSNKCETNTYLSISVKDAIEHIPEKRFTILEVSTIEFPIHPPSNPIQLHPKDITEPKYAVFSRQLNARTSSPSDFHPYARDRQGWYFSWSKFARTLRWTVEWCNFSKAGFQLLE